jgi:selenoprotein W-related protein
VSRGVNIEIEYCDECGYLEPALRLTQALLQTHAHYIAGIRLVPSGDGAFEVTIDGELVHSAIQTARFPKAEEIRAAVQQRAQGTPDAVGPAR